MGPLFVEWPHLVIDGPKRPSQDLKTIHFFCPLECSHISRDLNFRLSRPKFRSEREFEYKSHLSKDP